MLAVIWFQDGQGNFMSDESRELKVMRLMAWSRAQGELHSMLTTHYCGRPGENYERLHNAIVAFIKEIEEKGLHE